MDLVTGINLVIGMDLVIGTVVRTWWHIYMGAWSGEIGGA